MRQGRCFIGICLPASRVITKCKPDSDAAFPSPLIRSPMLAQALSNQKCLKCNDQCYGRYLIIEACRHHARLHRSILPLFRLQWAQVGTSASCRISGVLLVPDNDHPAALPTCIPNLNQEATSPRDPIATGQAMPIPQYSLPHAQHVATDCTLPQNMHMMTWTWDFAFTWSNVQPCAPAFM